MAARIPEVAPEDQIKKIPIGKLRTEYAKISKVFDNINCQKIMYCHKCGQFVSESKFVEDHAYASGYFPVCSDCLLDMATDYDKANNRHIDVKDKAKTVAQFMDIPFIESVYDQAYEAIKSAESIRARTAWQQLLSTVRSYTNKYKDMHWKDSEFIGFESGDEDSDIMARPQIRELFGEGFSETDYLFLQRQYDDWCSRTSVDSKSQETYIVRICFKLLDIWKAQKNGKDTKELDKSLNDLMAAANLQPKQNVANAAVDSLTFGQLIEKWEIDKPIPDPDEEFKDVNNIGKLIRVYFAGHLSKALGLRNGYAEEYEAEMSKYTVTKPETANDAQSSVYQQVFGADE